jgi:hypothetical protein
MRLAANQNASPFGVNGALGAKHYLPILIMDQIKEESQEPA